jgi:hypothetical protein
VSAHDIDPAGAGTARARYVPLKRIIARRRVNILNDLRGAFQNPMGPAATDPGRTSANWHDRDDARLRRVLEGLGELLKSRKSAEKPTLSAGAARRHLQFVHDKHR